MRVRTTYVSALGGEFDTAAQAAAHEDRLPQIIATYEGDLPKFVVGGLYGGEVLTAADVEEKRAAWARAIADYKEKWAAVQAQRAAAPQTAPSYHDVVVYAGEKRMELFNAGFGLDLRCCRAAGWELWDVSPGRGKEVQLAGEYGDPKLCVEVRGVVVVGERPAAPVEAHAGGWNGRVQAGP